MAWNSVGGCTCHLGRCPRLGHRPMSADCGHPGVFGRTSRLTYCYRAACREQAAVASAILALTSKKKP